MSTAVEVPITIEPDAAARVAELGYEKELEQMLEHTRAVVPGLRSIDVVLAYDPEEDSPPTVFLEVVRDDPQLERDKTDWDWGVWLVDNYPPKVSMFFCMLSNYGAPNDR